MRTERRKVSLDDVSKNYQDKAQQNMQNAEQKGKNGNVSPSPVLGTIVGLSGAIGSITAWLKNVPLLIAVLIAILGCVGATVCRGDNGDYDSISARICVGAAVISAIAGIIILTVYFKSLGIWEFTSNM